MKLVKNFSLAVLLALVLSVSVPAGEVPMPGASATPTPTPSSVMSSSDGNTDDPISATETSDYLFFEALAALLSVY